MKVQQTDNSNLKAKLDLRRHFLDRWEKPIRVFDACQGEGKIWGQLKKEYEVDSYFGADTKTHTDALHIDSRKIIGKIAYAGRVNVFDIDTYGSPWGHYFKLCENLRNRCLAFLTYGSVGYGNMANVVKEAIGLTIDEVPITLLGRLREYVVSSCLTRGCDNGIIYHSIVEAVTSRRGIHYYGIDMGAE